MLTKQRQSATAFRQQASDLAAATMQQMAGIAVDQRAELVRLSNAHVESQNRQRIVETALVGLCDVALECGTFLRELAARQGMVANDIDARRTTATNHNTVVDMNIRSQVLNLFHTHTSQCGAYV